MSQVLASNPFISSYAQSDLFGKIIIISLLVISAFSWAVLIYKLQYSKALARSSVGFVRIFQKSLTNPLNFDYRPNKRQPNAFFQIYKRLKQATVEILGKNKLSAEEANRVYLSSADIEAIAFQVDAQIQKEREQLETHLPWLATTYSLAPFLGLLGTVWGILLTFSELQNLGSGSGSPLVLGGLSMALATTVLGLVIAIPALVGHNVLKAKTKAFEIQMRAFATEAIGAIDLQYRKVER